jgi:hypothetical protein
MRFKKNFLLFVSIFLMFLMVDYSHAARRRNKPNQPPATILPVAVSPTDTTFDMNLCNVSLSSLSKLPTLCQDMDMIYGYRIPLGCTSYLPANSVAAIQKIVDNLNEYLKGKGMTVSAQWMNQDLFTLGSSQSQSVQQPVSPVQQQVQQPEATGVAANQPSSTNNSRQGIFRRRNKDANYRVIAVAQEDAASDVTSPVDVNNTDNTSTDVTANDNASTGVSASATDTGIGGINIIAQETTPVQQYVANISDNNFCSEQKVQFDKLPKSCVELQFAFNCKSPKLNATETNDFFNYVMAFTRLFNYKYTVTTLLYKGSVTAPVDNTSTEESSQEVNTPVEESVQETQPVVEEPVQPEQPVDSTSVEEPTQEVNTPVEEPIQPDMGTVEQSTSTSPELEKDLFQ